MSIDALTDSQILLLIPLVVWDLVWKGLAVWRAARNNQLGWFIVLLIISSAGILPIIYLLTHKSSKA